MAKRSGGLTEAKIERWIKEGRGSGRGTAYSPWLRVRDVPSQGRSHRIFGYKSRRTHHLFSDLELAVFLTLDWSPQTTEIREQFPLQRQLTVDLAKEASIKHPESSGILQVMSSDFLVNSADPDLPKFVLQAKYANALGDPRIVEKLELERRYWTYKEVPWFLVTERNISSTAFQNIEWLYPDQQKAFDLNFLADRLKFYSYHFSKNPSATIIEISKYLDAKYSHEAGETLAEIRGLLASRLLSFDVNIPFRKLTPECINYAEDFSVLEVISV